MGVVSRKKVKEALECPVRTDWGKIEMIRKSLAGVGKGRPGTWVWRSRPFPEITDWSRDMNTVRKPTPTRAC